MVAMPRRWNSSTGSLMQYCLICSMELVCPSGSVRLEMWMDLISVQGPAVRMPGEADVGVGNAQDLCLAWPTACDVIDEDVTSREKKSKKKKDKKRKK